MINQIDSPSNDDTLFLIDSKVSWHNSWVRWIALLMACLFQLGSYYCTDFPSVLSDELKQSFDNVTNYDVNLLYTYYSLPNVIMPLIGGILIDKVGIRTGLIGFYILLLIGQGLCVVGAISKTFWWLLVGRFIFGLGGENCVVAQSTIVSKWFSGKETALALGLNITFARLGSVINATLAPKTYVWFDNSLTAAFIVGEVFLMFSWIDGIGLAYLDKLSDKRDGSEQKIEQDKISLKDIREFKADFYLLTTSCLLSYTAFFLFQQNNVEMFTKIYFIEKDLANQMYSIPFYSAAVLTPILGYVIDLKGRRCHFLIFSGILITFVNVFYYMLPQCEEQCLVGPIIGQIFIGVFYSLYAAVMWPCVPICVPERTVGTAFGIVNAVQNIGLTIVPILIGKLIEDQTYQNYQHMMLFFIALSITALISDIALFIVDKKKGGKMGKPSSALNQIEPEGNLDYSIPSPQNQ